MDKHKVFISYHHENDEDYKKKLLELNKKHVIFTDKSIDTRDIDENLIDETIRTKIRDEYLKDSTVTIVLIGTETKKRKHIDWEIYSSMIDGVENKKSGILLINLPSTQCNSILVSHDDEKELYPKIKDWSSIDTKKEYEEKQPYMPQRIIDNLLTNKAKISITTWDYIKNSPKRLKALIDLTFKDRENCIYDFTQNMKKKNS